MAHPGPPLESPLATGDYAFMIDQSAKRAEESNYKITVSSGIVLAYIAVVHYLCKRNISPDKSYTKSTRVWHERNE